ncbi:MAG: hypothetical protein J6S85_01990 [Methanobrevibacter sp.]|nr:hypothetical protein [Methanobrevibacter sp.]
MLRMIGNFYELHPTDGRKSFYGKALVLPDDKGGETLYSYNTPIIHRDINGKLTRLYFGEWTLTTGRHVLAFCGLDKKEFETLK